MDKARIIGSPELGRTLDFFKVWRREKAEGLAAFATHNDQVTAGYIAAAKASCVSQLRRSRPVKAGFQAREMAGYCSNSLLLLPPHLWNRKFR